MKPIRRINKEDFQKYGYVLDFSEDFEGGFEIVVTEPNEPWRLAVYRPANQSCDVLEKHPGSMESFEPQKGTALLLVAETEHPEKFETFLLDRPVCLYSGIWHNVISLSENVLIRVTENAEVTSDFYNLPTPVSAGIG